MKREIKFRAWNDGEMVYNVMLTRDGYYCDLDLDIEKIDMYKNIPVMQYTGLKDKNGKEIYEGDIVWFGKDEYSYRVVFENGSFVLYHTKIEDWDGSPYRWGFLSRSYDVDMKNLGKIEVIGNIHENPELLK